MSTPQTCYVLDQDLGKFALALLLFRSDRRKSQSIDEYHMGVVMRSVSGLENRREVDRFFYRYEEDEAGYYPDYIPNKRANPMGSPKGLQRRKSTIRAQLRGKTGKLGKKW